MCQVWLTSDWETTHFLWKGMHWTELVWNGRKGGSGDHVWYQKWFKNLTWKKKSSNHIKNVFNSWKIWRLGNSQVLTDPHTCPQSVHSQQFWQLSQHAPPAQKAMSPLTMARLIFSFLAPKSCIRGEPYKEPTIYLPMVFLTIAEKSCR